MLNLNTTRPPGSIRLLCDAAPDYGVDPAQCLEGTGLEPYVLHGADTKVTLRQELTVIENFLRLAPKNPGLGIEIGRRYQPEVFGIWGYAIVSSPSLMSGLLTAIDYANLSFIIATVGLDERHDPPLITFDTRGLQGDVKAFVLQRHMTVLTNFREKVLPDFPITDYAFKTTVTDPAFAEVVKEKLGVTAELGCDVDAYIMSRDMLNTRLKRSDPTALKFYLDQCEALSPQFGDTITPWSARVRDAVLPKITTPPAISEVAQQFGLTERTLRRRLTEEGTSFREILTDARLSIAHELLVTARLDVSTVGWRTGYSDPSSFVRAFSKKYGHPPGDLKWRRALPR